MIKIERNIRLFVVGLAAVSTLTGCAAYPVAAGLAYYPSYYAAPVVAAPVMASPVVMAPAMAAPVVAAPAYAAPVGYGSPVVATAPCACR